MQNISEKTTKSSVCKNIFVNQMESLVNFHQVFSILVGSEELNPLREEEEEWLKGSGDDGRKSASNWEAGEQFHRPVEIEESTGYEGEEGGVGDSEDESPELNGAILGILEITASSWFHQKDILCDVVADSKNKDDFDEDNNSHDKVINSLNLIA